MSPSASQTRLRAASAELSNATGLLLRTMTKSSKIPIISAKGTTSAVVTIVNRCEGYLCRSESRAGRATSRLPPPRSFTIANCLLTVSSWSRLSILPRRMDAGRRSTTNTEPRTRSIFLSIRSSMSQGVALRRYCTCKMDAYMTAAYNDTRTSESCIKDRGLEFRET